MIFPIRFVYKKKKVILISPMRTFLFIVLLPAYFFGQEFPYSWTGTYHGEMQITSGNKKTSVTVALEIREKVKDSSWIYKMTYQAPSGEVVKDYQIIKKNDSEFIMDEGAIKIGMRYVDNTFFDYYQVDSTFYTSTLRKTGKNTLHFDIYGGSIGEKNKLTTNEESFFVHSYLPAFVQSVRLKRKKK